MQRCRSSPRRPTSPPATHTPCATRLRALRPRVPVPRLHRPRLQRRHRMAHDPSCASLSQNFGVWRGFGPRTSQDAYSGVRKVEQAATEEKTPFASGLIAASRHRGAQFKNSPQRRGRGLPSTNVGDPYVDGFKRVNRHYQVRALVCSLRARAALRFAALRECRCWPRRVSDHCAAAVPSCAPLLCRCQRAGASIPGPDQFRPTSFPPRDLPASIRSHGVVGSGSTALTFGGAIAHTADHGA